ncbi:hypothetical protein J7643_09805 [bacterium]|nr:hypothetical protein [bacterium]
MRKLSMGLVLGAFALSLVGCGLAPQGTARVATKTVSSVKALDNDHDVTHAKLNAIVKRVLSEQMSQLLATVDQNRDGAIATAEYAAGRPADVVELFVTHFDGNKDGKVTPAEHAAGLQKLETIEAYHHLVEQRMGKAIAPYTADKDFDYMELREYLTKDLGLTGDFPFVTRLFAKCDLNEDEKLLSAKGEGPVFLLLFARPQLEGALGLTVNPIEE